MHVRVLSSHIGASQEVLNSYVSVINLIEDMLRNQLVLAIGREVSLSDFCKYMSFHYRQLYHPNYTPKPFTYAVRRSPQQSPAGNVSIECITHVGGPSLPIESIVRATNSSEMIAMSLNSLVSVSCQGRRYLHACLQVRRLLIDSIDVLRPT